MSKISTYSLADTPLSLSDRLIGTEAFRTTPTPTPLATKNFSLGELLQLFSANFPAASLQAVLNTGNTATQNINLTGTIDVTLIKPDNIEDTSGSQGTVFQYLSKGASSINWVDLPIDTLQAVLNAGNTATQNITLVGDITTTKIIPGNIQDDTAGIGTTGQFLSKTASGIRWVNSPAATTPTLGDVVSVGNTANQDIFINGLTIGKGSGTGATNTALGSSALLLSTTGYFNVATGAFTLTNNTTGNRNTALGYGALYQNLTGNLNVAIGSYASLNSQTGLANVALGYATLNANLIGNFNTGLGYRALFSNLADKNTAVGTEVMFSNTTGTFNTVVGQEALRTNLAGSFNSIVGNFALLNAEASYVSALGRDAGRFSFAGNLTTASESIFVGYNSKSLNTSSVNEIVIGANVVGLGNNTIVLGSDSIVTTALTGNVGIGTKAPSQKLHVDGNFRVTGAVYDSTNSPGTAGQVLASTVTGTDWVNAGTVTSIGMTVPSAFNVTPSTITSSGTFAITGAGVASQYVRGDGTLANFPTSTGGGASVSYYLNGSISQGTIGGVAYKEMNSVPVIGTGTDFTINADGYIAQFITDVGDPNKLLIPGGNWNFETYFSASSGGGSPSFYIELYKYNGTTFTLIASNSTSPENITGGTSIDLYFSALAVPPTTLTVTDRLAVRFYVIHSGRTITMHTENSHLSQVITTFSSGLTALNGLTSQVQYFAVGTSGTDFNISSATDTHTFNLPTASAANRGALSSADWTAFNSKANASGTTNYVSKFTGTTTLGNSQIFDNGTNVGIGTTSPAAKLHINNASTAATNFLAGNVNGGAYFGWDSDNTGLISTYTNAPIKFGGNYASSFNEWMRINSSGNVGIGTTSPNSYSNLKTLTINGTNGSVIDFTANGVLYGEIYAQANDFRIDAIGSSGVLKLLTNSAERMRITSSGSVGIGTTTPGTINSVAFSGVGLQVTSGSLGRGILEGSSQAELLLNDSGATANQRIKAITSDGGKIFLGAYDDNGTSRKQVTIDDSGNVGVGTTFPLARLQVRAPGALSTDIALRVKDSADSADFMVVNGLGNVGVGITTPIAKLHVANTLETEIRASENTNNNFIGLTQQATTSYLIAGRAGATPTQDLSIYTGGGEKMRILANGNVGIGTSSPTRKVTIGGTSNAYMNFNATSNRNFLIGSEGYGFVIYDEAVGYRMVINSTGNVGIGTTNPVSILDVQSAAAVVGPTLKVSNTNTGGGNLLQLDRATNSRVNGINFSTAGVEDWSLGVLRNGGSPTQVFSLSYQSGSNINSTGFAVTSAGNVGIGTTAPSYKLEVQGTGTSTPLRVVSSGNTSILLSRAGTTDNGDATLTVTNSGALNVVAQNVIRMVPYSSETARFTNTGLGIGTSAPVGRLDVRAPGALSIDTAFRVRNSADSNNLMIINGEGGIGVGTTSPLPSAVLDINSTTQGFLPPRMTNAQRTAISLPAVGLMVYCTDATEGLYIYKSTGWTFII